MPDFKLIYYTDDDDDDRQLMQEVAHSLGHNAHVFSNPADMLKNLI